MSGHSLPADPPRERDAYWDNAKGLLVLLVVFGHVLEQGFDTLPVTKLIWTLVYSFHMPAFLMVSGFMAGRSRRDPVEHIPKMLGCYLVMQTLFAVERVALGTSDAIQLRLLNPGFGCWYLLFLAYANLTAHFLTDKTKKPALCLAVFVGLIHGFDPSLTNDGGLVRFATFFIFFLLGYYLDLAKLAERLRRHRLVSLALFMAIDGALLFLVQRGWFNRRQLLGAVAYRDLYPGQLWRAALMQLVCYGIGLLLSLCFFALVPRGKSLLTYIGKNSLWVFLIHILFVNQIYDLLTAGILNGASKRGACMAMAIDTAFLIALIAGFLGIRELVIRHRNQAPT